MKDTVTNRLIKKSECSEEIEKKFLDHISQFQGIVTAQGFKSFTEATIEPRKIVILDIKSFLESHLSEDKKILAVKTHSLHDDIATNFLNDLSFTCKGCSTENQATAKISSENTSQSFHLEIGTLQKVLVSQSDVRAHKKLDKRMFHYKILPMKNNIIPFNKLDELEFYRLARSLKAGKPLVQKNVIKNNIIKYGDHVTCFYKNNGISLKSQAIAKTNGQIDDSISLMHPKTKKTFNAKVIGINKVQVEI